MTSFYDGDGRRIGRIYWSGEIDIESVVGLAILFGMARGGYLVWSKLMPVWQALRAEHIHPLFILLGGAVLVVAACAISLQMLKVAGSLIRLMCSFALARLGLAGGAGAFLTYKLYRWVENVADDTWATAAAVLCGVLACWMTWHFCHDEIDYRAPHPRKQGRRAVQPRD